MLTKPVPYEMTFVWVSQNSIFNQENALVGSSTCEIFANIRLKLSNIRVLSSRYNATVMSGAAARQADVRTIQAWRIQNILQSIAQCPASVFSVHGAASGSCVPATMELSLPGHTPPPGCLCSTGESAGREISFRQWFGALSKAGKDYCVQGQNGGPPA